MGINIFSGEQGLGGKLTNPTEISFRKGSITERFPVRYESKTWPDVETAYLALKTENPQENDQRMIELIALKFAQHPALYEEVTQRGGAAFLAQCSHFTSAKSPSFQSWEGKGLASRFIRNLVAGYNLAASGKTVIRQGELF